MQVNNIGNSNSNMYNLGTRPKITEINTLVSTEYLKLNIEQCRHQDF